MKESPSNSNSSAQQQSSQTQIGISPAQAGTFLPSQLQNRLHIQQQPNLASDIQQINQGAQAQNMQLGREKNSLQQRASNVSKVNDQRISNEKVLLQQRVEKLIQLNLNIQQDHDSSSPKKDTITQSGEVQPSVRFLKKKKMPKRKLQGGKIDHSIILKSFFLNIAKPNQQQGNTKENLDQNIQLYLTIMSHIQQLLNENIRSLNQQGQHEERLDQKRDESNSQLTQSSQSKQAAVSGDASQGSEQSSPFNNTGVSSHKSNQFYNNDDYNENTADHVLFQENQQPQSIRALFGRNLPVEKIERLKTFLQDVDSQKSSDNTLKPPTQQLGILAHTLNMGDFKPTNTLEGSIVNPMDFGNIKNRSGLADNLMYPQAVIVKNLSKDNTYMSSSSIMNIMNGSDRIDDTIKSSIFNDGQVLERNKTDLSSKKQVYDDNQAMNIQGNKDNQEQHQLSSHQFEDNAQIIDQISTSSQKESIAKQKIKQEFDEIKFKQMTYPAAILN